MKKKNWIALAIMTVIFCIAAVIVYKTTIVPRMVFPRVITNVAAKENHSYLLLDGDHLEQTFTYEKDTLLSVGTQISFNEEELTYQTANKHNQDLGTITVTILDASDRKVLMSQEYQVWVLDNKQNLLASLSAATAGWNGKQLTMVIDVKDIYKDLNLSIGTTAKAADNTSLTLNGKSQNYTLNIKTADHQFTYWKKWAAFGAALIYILLAGSYLGLAVLRARPEKVFLFTGGILALIYLLLIPPLAVPDEAVHMRQAYYYSNMLLGVENQGEGMLTMDKEDFDAMNSFATTPSLSEYDTLKDAIRQSGREEGQKTFKLSDTQAPVITYIPGILGLSIGRLLGLNGILVFTLGRLCAILLYLFTMYWFIRLMPFGKAAAFLIAILPMTIQQCTSYSYDAVVIEIAFLYMALLFSLIYKDRPIRIWQMVLYGFCMIVLAITKGGAYMPLCLLTMLIPAARFPEWKKFLPKTSAVKRKWTFVGGMALIAVASFLAGTLSYVLYVAAPTAAQASGSYLQGKSFGASGLLHNPMTFFLLSSRTLIKSADGLLEQMLGMQLGWLDISISRVVIYGFLVMMVLSVLVTENNPDQSGVDVTVSHKLFYLFAFICSGAVIFASMFMSWTPLEAKTIEGLQGRYFLPALPAILLLFRNRNVIVRRDISRYLIYIGIALQCVSVYCILLSLEQIL